MNTPDFNAAIGSAQRFARESNEGGLPRIPGIFKLGAGALAVVIAVLVIWPFHSVPTGSRGVITRFGAIRTIEAEGLVIMPPWERLDIFNVRAEEASIDGAEGSTSDTQPVKVSLTVRYSITPDKVSEVFEKYSRNGDLTSYVATATQEVFKAVTAQYTAPDLIAKRSQVSAAINSALKLKLAQYGAQVINIDMRNFSFSPDYMAAISEKVTQEQKKLAAENKVKTIEAEQRAKIVTAEAEAKATVLAAQAQADSLRIQNEALAKNREVLELRRIEVEMEKAKKWNGALPQNIYAGAPIPFLDVGKSVGAVAAAAK